MSDEQQIDELRGDIAQTREGMSETLEQIEQKLSPDNVQDEVLKAVRELSDQLLSEFQSKSDTITERINEQIQTAIHGAAMSKADSLVNQAQDTLLQVGRSVWTRLEDNPAPIALTAIGIGMMAMGERNGHQGGQNLLARGQQAVSSAMTNIESGLFNATESAGEMTDQAGSTLGETAEQMKARAGEMAGQLTDRVTQMAGGSGSGGVETIGGFAGGLLALGIGFMAGLAVPETERERQAMEPVRTMLHEQMDKLGVQDMRGDAAELVDSVKQAGADIASNAREALSSARQ